MTKQLVVVQGPVATRSGYGNHTRDLVRSLIAMDKYDLRLISLPWGNCPMTALNAADPNDKLLDQIPPDPAEKVFQLFVSVGRFPVVDCFAMYADPL